MNSMSIILFFYTKGSGHQMPDFQILFKFLTSFSAHCLTICLGLPFWWVPQRNLNSPSTYHSQSLKIRIEVLKTLIAKCIISIDPNIVPPSFVQILSQSQMIFSSETFYQNAWYTFASLPVEIHPNISVNVLFLIHLKRMFRVLGSRT